MSHPFLNCEKCDPNVREACKYPDNVCVREATLPPEVCPMFGELSVDNNNIAAKQMLPP